MIPLLPFGRTGHQSSRIIFGGAALWHIPQQQADAALDLLTEYGVNHIDTAASYANSEVLIGPWLRPIRGAFFLATKTEMRTKRDAWRNIRDSLTRLQTDVIDLLQLHNVSTQSDWEQVFAPGGALEAALEARRDGLVRFIGITGHGLGIARLHRLALERFDFDSVLLPYSYILYQNPQYADDFEALLEVCQARSVAVQTIKSIVRGPWGARPHTRNTWYEPLEDQADIDLAVHWVLGRPGVFLNTVGDIHVLPRVLDAASRFQSRPTGDAMQSLLTRQSMAPLFT